MPLRSFGLPGEVSSLLFILASLTGLRAGAGSGRGGKRVLDPVSRTPVNALPLPAQLLSAWNHSSQCPIPPDLLMCASPGTGAPVRPQIRVGQPRGRMTLYCFHKLRDTKDHSTKSSWRLGICLDRVYLQGQCLQNIYSELELFRVSFGGRRRRSFIFIRR